MNETLRIVIADDHPIFRKGLVEVVGESPGLLLLEAVADGAAAVESCVRHQPDVLVADFEMPRMNGADAARELRARDLPTAVIILTGHKDEGIFNAALDAGASGFVLKDNAAEELVACIRSVARGEPYVSPSASRFLLRRGTATRALRRERPGLEDLTPRERWILQLVADNLTSKEIAARLCLSPRTVENHRFRITEKLGLAGSHSLLKFALENKSRL